MMPDLSDKYRRALDEIDISPDFKERTFGKMIEIRGEEPQKRNIVHTHRWLSAAAAAAACVAVVIAAGRHGAFDGGILETKTETEPETGAVTAVTEDTPTAEVYTYADVTEAAVHAVPDREAMPEEEAEEDPVPETVEEIYEDAAEEEAAIIPVGEDMPTAAEEDQTAPPAAVTAEAPETSVMIKGYTPADIADNAVTVIGDGFISGEEAYVAPSAEQPIISDDDTIVEEDAEEPAAGGNDGVASEGEAIDGEGDTIIEESIAESVGYGKIPTVATADFSAGDAFGALKGDISASLTANFEEYSEESRTVVSYKPVTVTDGNEIKAVMELLAGYSDQKAASVQTLPPDRARFIIDLADDQGNSLRVCTAKSGIWFMTSGDSGAVYYVFALDSEESTALEAELHGYFG